MLFIFRKLRRSFFLPGKVRTYMAYAVGEIVLIVVGILIALQISNWNEKRIQRDLARSYILALHQDFMQNEERIKQVVSDKEGTKRAARSLTVFLDQGYLTAGDGIPAIKIDDEFRKDWPTNRNRYVPITDTATLIHNINRAGFVINYDLILPVWEEIISSGILKLIDNQELKREIAELYLFAGECEDLESNIEIPVIKEYQDLIARYIDVSKSRAARPFAEGVSVGDTWMDIDGLRTDGEVKYHLQRVFKVANLLQDNLKTGVSPMGARIIDILNEEIGEFE